MRERETLLRIAPHLVVPLPFLMPLYRRSPFYRLKLRVGMFLYDLLSLDKSLPKRRRLGRSEALAAEPNLDPDGLGGAWRFYDAQVPFVERLVVENAVDAAAHGALILNHAVATGYLRDGSSVVGASVQDRIGGSTLEVRARFTVNATGPWLDGTLAPLRPDARPLLRLTKGAHLVVPCTTEHAPVLFLGFFRRDDRHQFDLGELVLADHAARVFSRRARLGAEARRTGGQPHRQLGLVDDGLAHEVRQWHFGGGDEPEARLPKSDFF